MKIVRWIAMFTGVTLLSSILGIGGMLLWNSVVYPSESQQFELPPAHVVEAPRPTTIPVIEEPFVVPLPPSTEVPVIHRRREPEQTAVQAQPSFYASCFGEETWRCRRMFNRTISEVALMHRFRTDETSGLPEITKLVLGRIILSEVNWLHDERRDRNFPEQNHAERDAPAIYQVLRHTRRNGETLLGAMRRHAPHVSEAREISGRLLERRMAWITQLQLDCARPNGFPEADREGNPIDWVEDGYQERCEALFTYAQRLLDGDGDVVAWETAPLVTWGGRCETPEGACDDDNGYARGLVPFETGNTANRFWCRPSDRGCPTPALSVEAAEVATEEGVVSAGPVAGEVELTPSPT